MFNVVSRWQVLFGYMLVQYELSSVLALSSQPTTTVGPMTCNWSYSGLDDGDDLIYFNLGKNEAC